MFQHGERYYRAKDMVLVPASDKLLAQWVTAIQWAAKSANPPPRPIDGPWYCALTFWFMPPKTRYGQTWAIGDKRESPLARGTSPTGDEDKLRRAVLDALTGIFWSNDRHVCDGRQTKLYCANRKPGATVLVRYLDDAQLDLVNA